MMTMIKQDQDGQNNNNDDNPNYKKNLIILFIGKLLKCMIHQEVVVIELSM